MMSYLIKNYLHKNVVIGRQFWPKFSVFCNTNSIPFDLAKISINLDPFFPFMLFPYTKTGFQLFSFTFYEKNLTD